MEGNYVEYSKVLPGNVAVTITNLVTGEYGVNTDSIVVKRADCTSYAIGYLPMEAKLVSISGSVENIDGIEGLEERLRGLISSGYNNSIFVTRKNLGNFELLYK